MFDPLTLTIIAVAIVATSFLSGIFGMAGGIVLLGVLLVYMDVAPAMVLFGVIQTAANGSRVVLWRKYVLWGIVWRFLVGSLVLFLILRTFAFVPPKAIVYLGLGLIPFVADLLPRSWTPDITRPGAPYFCGGFIMILQLLAGAAGHILDVFFQKSRLDRKTIVATKAVTQVGGHMFRIAYFGSFAAAFDSSLSWYIYVAAVALAILGTSLAARVLERMTDESFRAWSRYVVIAVSVVFLGRGLWLLATQGLA